MPGQLASHGRIFPVRILTAFTLLRGQMYVHIYYILLGIYGTVENKSNVRCIGYIHVDV